MLSEIEKQRFNKVCLEHIWAAVGMHVLCGASGSDSDARSAAISVRDLVDIAPAYRKCWEQIRPVVRTQGFESFIAIVDDKTSTQDPTPAGEHTIRGEALVCNLTAERVLARAKTAAPVEASEAPELKCMATQISTKEETHALRDREESRLPTAKLKVLGGQFLGRELELNKALTQLGQRGKHRVAILRQKEGYSIVSVERGRPDDVPQINGSSIGPGTLALHDNDVVQIAGIKALFMLN